MAPMSAPMWLLAIRNHESLPETQDLGLVTSGEGDGADATYVQIGGLK
jgi:hypothetical protein